MIDLTAELDVHVNVDEHVNENKASAKVIVYVNVKVNAKSSFSRPILHRHNSKLDVLCGRSAVRELRYKRANRWSPGIPNMVRRPFFVDRERHFARCI